MPDYINRTTKQLVKSKSPSDCPIESWLMITRNQYIKLQQISSLYLIIEKDTVREMTTDEKAGIDQKVAEEKKYFPKSAEQIHAEISASMTENEAPVLAAALQTGLGPLFYGAILGRDYNQARLILQSLLVSKIIPQEIYDKLDSIIPLIKES